MFTPEGWRWLLALGALLLAMVLGAPIVATCAMTPTCRAEVTGRVAGRSTDVRDTLRHFRPGPAYR